MFIYNFNIGKLKKIFIAIITSVLVILTIIFVFYLINNPRKSFTKDECSPPEVIEIPVANYTNFLNDCYKNLDNYLR